MKTLIFAVVVVGFSGSAALADCTYHKVNAAADVDQSITTASVEKQQQNEQAFVKKQEQPAETEATR